MTPAPDYIGELSLIELSRLQRELFGGWLVALTVAGEHEEAAALQKITRPDRETELMHRRAA